MAVNPNTFDPSSIITNANTRFCTLPGQEPIVLSTVHGGHGCRIADTPRTVPIFFHQEAISKGAYTEEQIVDLKTRLAGVVAPGTPIVQVGTPLTPPLVLQDSDDDGFAPSPQDPAPPAATSERTEQIKVAIIDLLNTGNPSDFTSSGTPKVEVLKEKLGFEVTGTERDSAYDAIKG